MPRAMRSEHEFADTFRSCKYDLQASWKNKSLHKYQSNLPTAFTHFKFVSIRDAMLVLCFARCAILLQTIVRQIMHETISRTAQTRRSEH